MLDVCLTHRRETSLTMTSTTFVWHERTGSLPDHRAGDTSGVVRAAVESDNWSLLELTASCPMKAEMDLCIRREPDFFELNRLSGNWWTVGVAPGAGDTSAGCVALASRRVYLNGSGCDSLYVGDLKVHPDYRNRGLAAQLTGWARATARERGARLPTITTILDGNTAAEHAILGAERGRGFLKIGTVNNYSIALTLPMLARARDYIVRCATADDFEEMGSLWSRVAPRRQFAPVLDAAAMQEYCRTAPGLPVSTYWLARRRNGSLAGFAAFWDQRSFKHTTVLRYSKRARAFQRSANVFARIANLPQLPKPGGGLVYANAFNLCFPFEEAAALRAILKSVVREYRRRSFHFINLGLDARDPVGLALHGFPSVVTRINAYVTEPTGPYRGASLRSLPVHFETALV